MRRTIRGRRCARFLPHRGRRPAPDTDKKTITVPWNYSEKLAEVNRMIKEYGGKDAPVKTFTGYINEIWENAIKNSDACLKTANKPVKASKEK